MKKLLFAICASSVLFSADALAQYYRVIQAGVDKMSAPELESSPDNQLIWGVSNVDQKYVKIFDGNTVQYKAFYVSGGSGNNHNMVVAMGNGSTLELSSTVVTSNNSPSRAWQTYGFETLNDGDNATINLTNETSSSFSLAYESTINLFPEDGKRGVNIGKGITVASAGDINIIDNTVDNGGDFTLNGNMIAGDSASKGVSIKDARFTQTTGSSIMASYVAVENTSDTVKRDAVFNGEVLADNLVLRNAKATLTAFNSLTADNATIRLEGGNSEIATTNYDTLASARISGIASASSTLKIVNDMSVLSINAPQSSIFVEKGISLNVGDGTEANAFDIGGTIKGTVTVNSVKERYLHAATTMIHSDLLIDGGLLEEVGVGNFSYDLVVRNATISLRNGGAVKTSSYLGISGGTYKVEDASSKIIASKIEMGTMSASGLGESVLILSSSSNIDVDEILIKDTNYSVARIILAKDDNAYQLGNVKFLRESDLTIVLNGASVEFSSIAGFNDSRATTSNLVFEDYANGFVKFNDGFQISEEGVVLSVADNISITILGVTTDGVLLTSGWSIDENGYLFNSNLSIPEPAEWATILGALALGLAVYRRRK